MKKEWIYNEICENDIVERVANKYKISKLLAKILISRNVVEDEKIAVFLQPKRNDFYEIALNDLEDGDYKFWINTRRVFESRVYGKENFKAFF